MIFDKIYGDAMQILIFDNYFMKNSYLVIGLLKLYGYFLTICIQIGKYEYRN